MLMDIVSVTTHKIEYLKINNVCKNQEIDILTYMAYNEVKIKFT